MISGVPACRYHSAKSPRSTPPPVVAPLAASPRENRRSSRRGCRCAAIYASMPRRKPVRPEQGVDHADDLGALVVDRRRVEIVDPQIGVGLHRVGQRAGILGELRGAQRAYVADAAHRRAALVGREQLIAKHRQPLLQRQLEPVAAGHPVAGPVVEILVRDDRLDVLVIGVGRGFGLGQHIARVEDVEPLVLHRPHVEVADGDDVEHVEIVFEAEHLLVPAHRFFQRGHRVAAFVLVAAADPDREPHVAARSGREAVLDRDQVAGDEREQVGRLRVRIDPARPMPCRPQARRTRPGCRSTAAPESGSCRRASSRCSAPSRRDDRGNR